MNNYFLKVVAVTGLIGLSLSTAAQTNHNLIGTTEQENTGSFSMDIRQQQITLEQAAGNLSQLLGLSGRNTLQEMSRDTDAFGITHVAYQQYFRGIPVQDAVVLIHLKDGLATSINGVVQAIPDDFPLPAHPLPAGEAESLAQEYLAVVKLISPPSAQVVMMKNKPGADNAYALAWKVRIDGWGNDNKIHMSRVFLDAQTGAVINTYPLLADAGVTGTAETFYRGTQQITIDSVNATTYRLRDSVRKVYTFDAGGIEVDSSITATSPFKQDVDYLNPDTDWGKIKTLSFIYVDSLADPHFLDGNGSGSYLLSVVGHGGLIPGDGQNLTSGFIYSNNLPLVAQGFQIPVKDDSLWGGVMKVNALGSLLKGILFSMPDSSVGTHHWDDSLGSTGKYVIEMDKNPALDAHWGIEETHDFYRAAFNRNSYDNNGSAVKNYLNGVFAISGTQSNAAALPAPYNCMVYGLGDGVTTGPFVGLDVLGHEFTHMVTNHNGRGGLNYQRQSGALNESFSDMMGTAIEFFVDSAKANWTIGEEVALTAPDYLRSMSNPKGPGGNYPGFVPQPDTYLGQHWYTGSLDNGGVHVNSGVPNKWFYLLTAGGSGTNDNHYHYQVSGLGIRKAQKIAYQTFTQYLTPTADFLDAYHASLNAAADLYGNNSSEYQSVKDAWLAVGIPHEEDPGAIVPANRPDEALMIYPNPASTQVTISSSRNQAIAAELYSITGAKVRTISIHPGQNIIPVGDLSKGTYLLKYEINRQPYARKLTLR